MTLPDHGNVQAIVDGITEEGYLRTRSTADAATTYELQPDGNSFDLMKNMIARKLPPP